MRGTVAFLAISLVWPSLSSAHRDTTLSLSADGSLRQLPNQYKDVRVKIEFREARPPTLRAVEFSRGKTVTRVPMCAIRAVRTRTMKDVQIYGSWYHDTIRLPHYLVVEFNDPGTAQDATERGSVRFMFNLRTTKLVRLESVIATETPRDGLIEMREDRTELCTNSKLQ